MYVFLPHYTNNNKIYRKVKTKEAENSGWVWVQRHEECYRRMKIFRVIMMAVQ